MVVYSIFTLMMSFTYANVTSHWRDILVDTQAGTERKISVMFAGILKVFK